MTAIPIFSTIGSVLDSILSALDNRIDRLGRRPGSPGHAPLAGLLLFPGVLILATFGLAPLLFAVYLSLFDQRAGEDVFVGLANFGEALGGTAFWDSLWVTVYFALGTIPTTMILSFLVANLLFRIVRWRGTLRTLYFLPYVTSVVAAAMIWRTLFEPNVGVASAVFEALGLPAQKWLLEPEGVLHILTNGAVAWDIGPSLALCCVMLFDIWHSSGFMVVLFLAGLAAVPRELEESARMDGAGWFHVTRNVTIPILSPTIFFLGIVGAIKSFQAFSSFYALTGDGHGPLDTTQNLTVYIYANFYEYGRIGYGSAVATLLCVAIVILTLVQWRLTQRRVFYQ